MKRVCYYHVYLSDDMGSWASMVLEQMKKMEDVGLLGTFDKMKVSCITQNDGREGLFQYLMKSDWHIPDNLDVEIELVKNPYSNDQEMLANIESCKTIAENYTYRKMWKDSRNEMEPAQYLYIHTKGITSTDNLLRRGNAEKYKMYYYWRQYLVWGVIENWEKCVEALRTYDVAGINYQDMPSPHFSGGFWWANASYLASLPNPETKSWWNDLRKDTNNHWLKTCSDRFRDEMWLLIPRKYCPNGVCKKAAEIYNVAHLPQRYNPAAITLPRAYYEKNI